jgi:hypothetical protein
LGYHLETWYLAVYIFDLYGSSRKVVHAKQRYLLCYTSLYLAAKFGEELLEPSPSQILEDSPYVLTSTDLKVMILIQRMERKVCNLLSFRFFIFTPHSLFLEFLENLDSCPCKPLLQKRLLSLIEPHLFALVKAGYVFNSNILLAQILKPVSFHQWNSCGRDKCMNKFFSYNASAFLEMLENRT